MAEAAGAAEAVATSLRLCGVEVTAVQVRDLHQRAGGTDGGDVSIVAALEAAKDSGLAGHTAVAWRDIRHRRVLGTGVILGLSRPGGRLAVTCDRDDRAWSCGELMRASDLAPGSADEAWAVTWNAPAPDSGDQS